MHLQAERAFADSFSKDDYVISIATVCNNSFRFYIVIDVHTLLSLAGALDSSDISLLPWYGRTAPFYKR